MSTPSSVGILPSSCSRAGGGTATNGIDYELPQGTIEIPARKKSAKIALKPLRDGLIEGPETIEIELFPGDDCTQSLLSKVAIELQSKDK